MSADTTTGLAGEVDFDPQAASVDAIQRAAYRLSDRLSVEIEVGETLRCAIYSSTDECADELLASFRNEVLDQVLRERIRNETAASRNVILALAFSQTGTVDAA